jgi:general secretion pathway protein I
MMASRVSGRRGFRVGGFTLVEVLVALVIVAVGMSALMGALGSSAKTVVYMQDKTFAEWVALNQIASVRIALQKGQIPAAGNTTGDIDLANRTWHWRQEVVESQVPGIRRIDVKVRPKDIKAGDDDGWYVTVSGLAGDSLGAPGTGPVMSATGTTQSLVPGAGNTPGANTPNSLNNNGTGNAGTGTGNQGNTGTGNTGTGNTGFGSTPTQPGNTPQ